MTAPSTAYAAHMAAARGLYEAQMRLIDARRRVAVPNADRRESGCEMHRYGPHGIWLRILARSKNKSFY